MLYYLRIQRWWRHWNKIRFFKHTVYNWDECDPITLEKVRDTPVSRLFLTRGHNGRVMAYDSIAWLEYFSHNCNRDNPATKVTMEPHDIWECYLTALRILPRWSKIFQKYHSKDLFANVSAHNTMKLYPQSPLCNVKFTNFTSSPAANKKKKMVHIRYQLIDRRDREKNMTPPLNVNFTVDQNIQIHFTS